jgi:hypothetical protein
MRHRWGVFPASFGGRDRPSFVPPVVLGIASFWSTTAAECYRRLVTLRLGPVHSSTKYFASEASIGCFKPLKRCVGDNDMRLGGRIGWPITN